MPAHPVIGVVPAPEQCRMPLGSVAVEMKYCELCGLPFVREPKAKEEQVLRLRIRFVGVVEQVVRRDTGQRLCDRCTKSRYMLADRVEELLEAQERYNIALPELDAIHRSSHPVRYDSTLGRETSSHRVNNMSERKVKRVRHPEWEDLIVQAFETRKRLTMEELCDILPGCYTPTQAWMYCHVHRNKLKLVKVDHKERSVESKGGRTPGIYELRMTFHA